MSELDKLKSTLSADKAAKDFVKKQEGWISRNPGKTALIVGILLAACIAGFIFWK